ncbi:MAG: DUF669 domain-containing protein [Fretibacterium sp.]|nr:DUF669 domain-containing protein [Fretibacterium sp.]
MAVLSQDFLKSFKSAEAGSPDLLPEGDYTVRVSGADVRQAKSGRGQYIHVQFDVLGPKFQGRRLFTCLNIVHDNQEAARIGQQQLRSLLLAGGMGPEQIRRFSDTDQLIGLTCSVRVEIEEGQDPYGPRNRVRGFRKTEDPQPGAPDTPRSVGAFAPAEDKPWFTQTS